MLIVIQETQGSTFYFGPYASKEEAQQVISRREGGRIVPLYKA